MKRVLGRGVLAAAMLAAMAGLTGLTATSASAATTPVGPDANITVAVGDDVAGGTYDIEFVPVYAGATPDDDPDLHLRPGRLGRERRSRGPRASTRTSTPTRPTSTPRAAVPWRTT